MTGKEIDLLNNYYERKVPFFVMVNYKNDKVHIHKLTEIPEDIKIETPIFSNSKAKKHNKYLKLKKQDFEFKKYKSSFEKVLKHIRLGNSYLCNLAVKTPIDINLNLDEIFEASHAPFKLKFKDDFVLFSPEKFIEIEKGKIYTYPMKGTIDANQEYAADTLLGNNKEFAEHSTIVDLLRNDLSKVCTNVEVDLFRYLDKIKTNKKTILQTSSKISGKINNEIGIGTILNNMLPAGSITGAPKDKTMNIIAEAENFERGYYCGVFGVFDGSKFSSSVMIRFISKENGQYYYYSGGGITNQSKLEEEYNEINDKIYVPIS